MKYFAKLKDLEFLIPVAIVAIVAVFVWNTFLSPIVSSKVGKDLTA